MGNLKHPTIRIFATDRRVRGLAFKQFISQELSFTGLMIAISTFLADVKAIADVLDIAHVVSAARMQLNWIGVDESLSHLDIEMILPCSPKVIIMHNAGASEMRLWISINGANGNFRVREEMLIPDGDVLPQTLDTLRQLGFESDEPK